MHGRIWHSVTATVGDGADANPVTLKGEFDRDEALKQVGGAAYLGRLAREGALVSHPEDYARIVRELALRRDVIAAAQDVLDAARGDLANVRATDIIGRAARRFDEMLGRAGSSNSVAGIDPRTLEGLAVPERRFLVRPWIPMGRATGLYGAGGIGKTTLAQMLCTSCALDPAKFPNANWLGLPVLHCRSVLLFCEDDADEMHARQAEINRICGCGFDDLGDMLWLPRLGTDATLMNVDNGRCERTQLFWELLAGIKAHRARLVVLDTLTDTFGGSEIDRRQARQFVQECPAYVAREIDGSCICCAHPSLAGIKSGSGSSGSTGWDGAFRSRLYLSPKEDDGDTAADADARILTRVKSNWACVGETIPMRWREGVFIADRPATGIIGSIERRTAERVFLDLLAATTVEKQPVSSNSRSGNYAAKLFATRPNRDGFTKEHFAAAMQRLFANRAIDNVTYGRKGDERTRIAVSLAAASTSA